MRPGRLSRGRIAYERGYGTADLERGVPITPASVFYVGSLSKQFTAFAGALAASEGKLSLDDEVRKWIPELPDYGSRLTVRHLVHHTSGLRDYNTLFDIAGRRNDEAFDNQTVLRIVSRQRALNFKPGEEYLYSNSGYVLLSLIVERATGTPLAAWAATRIFQPLGMRHTQFYDDVTRLVENRALAFARTASGAWHDDTPHSQRTGAGGVLTTVRDLLAWDNNVYEPKVGTRALISQVHETGTLNSAKALTYAYRSPDRRIPRAASGRARRLAGRLPGAPDALSGRAHIGGVPVQLRHEQSWSPRASCRRPGVERSVLTAGADVHRLESVRRWRERARPATDRESAPGIHRAIRQR